MPRKGNEVRLCPPVESELLLIANSRTRPSREVERAKIILKAADGLTNVEIAKRVVVCADTCSTWRNRYCRAAAHLEMVSAKEPETLAAEITAFLADEPRSGRPEQFTGEQVSQIMKIACDAPRMHGVEATRWTTQLLADCAVKKGIVNSISAKSVWRYLKSAGIRL